MPQSMQRAPCRLTSAGGSGRTNSLQVFSRASTFSYGRSLRSISRKPFTRPMISTTPLQFSLPPLGGLRQGEEVSLFRRYSLRCRPFTRLQQRALVVLRHHLDEARQDAVPVLEQLARPRRTSVQMVPLDQDAQPLGVEPQDVAHAVVLDVVGALARPARIV